MSSVEVVLAGCERSSKRGVEVISAVGGEMAAMIASASEAVRGEDTGDAVQTERFGELESITRKIWPSNVSAFPSSPQTKMLFPLTSLTDSHISMVTR